jgi:hypothetical protein
LRTLQCFTISRVLSSPTSTQLILIDKKHRPPPADSKLEVLAMRMTPEDEEFRRSFLTSGAAKCGPDLIWKSHGQRQLIIAPLCGVGAPIGPIASEPNRPQLHTRPP